MTDAPCSRAPSMNAAASAGEDTRMSRDTPMREAFR